LLTGLLPLMAEYDIPNDSNYEVDGSSPPFNSAEPIHDDALRSLPALPIEFTSTDDASSITGEYTTGAKPMPSELAENILVQNPIKKENTSRSETANGEPMQAVVDQQNEFSDQERKKVSLDETRGIEDAAENKNGIDSDQVRPQGDTSDSSDQEVTGPVESQDTQKGAESKTIKESEEADDGLIERVLVDYASKSAGALILEKSSSMKGTSNLLNGDKDKYAIAPCNDKKFVVIGLSEDILVKQVKLANYERYSSHVQTFQILGSQTMGDWVDLGTFDAHAGNGEQAFDLLEPSWARYLKFRFLSHFGMEHYCTISQIKVHGSTMLQGFREQWNDGDEHGGDVESKEGQEVPDVSQNSTDAFSVETEQAHVDNTGEEETEFHDRHGSLTQTTIEETPSKIDEVNDKADIHIGTKTVDDSAPTVADAKSAKNNIETFPLIDEDLKKRLVTAILDVHPEASPTSSDRIAQEIADNSSDSPPVDKKVATENFTALKAVNVAVKAFVAEASEVIISVAKEAPEAIEKLQQKIKTTIKAAHDRDPSTITESVAVHNEYESEVIDQMSGDADLYSVTLSGIDEFERKPDIKRESSQLSGDIEISTLEPEHGIETEKEIPPDTTEKAARDGNFSYLDVNNAETLSKQKDDIQYESSGYKIPEGLVDALRRFPNSRCLQNLNYPDLLASKANAKAAVTNGQHSGANLRMEPIFKTLTDEIKLLQVSQSVQDQFSKDLVACYQDIILDMAKEFERLQNEHETRLSRLEAEMNSMKSKGLFSLLANAVNSPPVLFTFIVSRISIAGLLFSVTLNHIAALIIHGYRLAFFVLNDGCVTKFAGRVFSKEPEAVLVVAGFIVVFALLLTATLKIYKKGKTTSFKTRNQSDEEKFSTRSRKQNGKLDYNSTFGESIMGHALKSNKSTPTLVAEQQKRAIQRQAQLVSAE